MLEKYNLHDIPCQCKQHGHIALEKIVVAGKALQQIQDFLHKKSYYHVIMVADEQTYRAAGERLHHLLSQSYIQITVCMLRGNHQGLIADGDAILQLLTQMDSSMDAVLAVGAGTIHDIVRMVCHKMNKPFISVPTAASVDGFTSAGAPLIIQGVKQTLQAGSPIALFADVEVLQRAPQEMTAAGLGDMLAKFTSLFDWRLSHLLADEPYCPKAAHITNQALRNCMDHIDDIAAGNERGLTMLMNSLIDSGLAMLLSGHSRPASGAEHHLSHYWEMDFLRQGQRQILHGAKVGVATIIIAELYQKKLSASLLKANSSGQANPILQRAAAHRREIHDIIGALPSADQLQTWLSRVKAPISPDDIDVQDELVVRSLKEAITLRDRYTGLRFLNEFAGL